MPVPTGPNTAPLLSAVVEWLRVNPNVQSAVHFGSAVGREAQNGAPDQWSDLDFHVIAGDTRSLEHIDWAVSLPGQSFVLQAARPATGGVRKVTALFQSGQLDLVVVPSRLMRVAAWGLRLNWHRQVPFLNLALNEMATCLHTGYSFKKGESRWGGHYRRVAVLPGVRLDDDALRGLANGFLCDLLWVLQKLDRGEIIAAQHVLHSKLSDANLRIWRELWIRRRRPLPSFGLGRRIEIIASEAEQKQMEINATATVADLRAAAAHLLGSIEAMMAALHTGWAIPPGMNLLLSNVGRIR